MFKNKICPIIKKNNQLIRLVYPNNKEQLKENHCSFYFKSIQCLFQGECRNPVSNKRNAILTVYCLKFNKIISSYLFSFNLKKPLKQVTNLQFGMCKELSIKARLMRSVRDLDHIWKFGVFQTSKEI